MNRATYLIALASGMVAVSARADTALYVPVERPSPPPVYEAEPWSRTRLSLTLGMEAGIAAYTGDVNAPGGQTDLRLDALVHWRHFSLGVTAEGGAVNFATYDWSFGVAGGPAWNIGRGRVMALAEVGYHYIGGIGQTLFNGGALTDETAFLPQAGINVRYVWVGASQGRVSFVAIFEAFARFDLLRQSRTYSSQPCAPDDGCNAVTLTSTAGGYETGLGASIGALF